MAVPPVVNPTWTSTLPWAARVPVAAAWLRAPLNRFRDPVAVRVVPAARVTVPRMSTPSRVWEPVIVPPAKTTVLPLVVNVPGTAV